MILLHNISDKNWFVRRNMVRKAKGTDMPVEEHPGGGHIAVTAQQSRYALDAVDTPASKEVCIYSSIWTFDTY